MLWIHGCCSAWAAVSLVTRSYGFQREKRPSSCDARGTERMQKGLAVKSPGIRDTHRSLDDRLDDRLDDLENRNNLDDLHDLHDLHCQ